MYGKTKNLLTGLAALLLFSASGSLLAQGNMADVWIMTVKPANQAAFEAAFKEHAAIRKEQGEAHGWDVFQPIIGEDLDLYAVRACCFSWADLDSHQQWEAETPGVMQDWMSTAGQYVDDYARFFDEIDMDNSNWPDGDMDIEYVGLTQYFVDPAHTADFAAAKTEVSQVAINQGWAKDHHWAWMQTIGGKPVTSIVVPYENLADMADDDPNFSDFMKATMGAEATAEVFGKFASSVRGSKHTIWKHRTDLTDTGDDG